MFLQGKEIGQSLGGMVIVRKTVPYGDAGFGGKLFHRALGIPPEFNGVEHASQYPGGVGNGFLLANLGACGPQVGGESSLVMGGHFEGTPGAGGVFLENKGKIFTV